MGLNTPPDHPDWQQAYRLPAVVAVGTPTAFASASGSVSVQGARGGLIVVAGSGPGGSVSLLSEPSGTSLINVGASTAVGTAFFLPLNLPPTDTSLTYAVVNGVLEVWMVDSIAAVIGFGGGGSVQVSQGAGATGAFAVPWLALLADPSNQTIPLIGQKGQADSLPVVWASDQPALPWQAASAARAITTAIVLAANANSVVIPAPGAGLALYLHSLSLIEAVSNAVNVWESSDGATQVYTDVAVVRGGSNTAFIQVDDVDLKGIRLPTNTGLRVRNTNATATGNMWPSVRYSVGP